MARSRTLFLPALLFLLLLAAGEHQPGDAAEALIATMCQPPEALATGVALFCAGRVPTAPCCRTLAQAGAACLCLLASQPPLAGAALNGTDLIGLYASCVHGLASSSSSSPSCDAVPGSSGSGGPCASLTLADQLVVFCGGKAAPPTAPCCEAVATAVGLGARDVPCFCRAAWASRIGVRGVVGLYNACGGLRPGLAGDLAKSCERLPKA